jgi:hypothetical protein
VTVDVPVGGAPFDPSVVVVLGEPRVVVELDEEVLLVVDELGDPVLPEAPAVASLTGRTAPSNASTTAEIMYRLSLERTAAAFRRAPSKDLLAGHRCAVKPVLDYGSLCRKEAVISS